MKKQIAAVVVLLSAMSLSSAEAAWPVIDSAVLAKAVQQLEEMKKQYDMLKKQYDELVATKNAVTGSYGVSLLENGPLDELSRRELPPTWQEVVSLQESGDLGGFYSERQDYFKKLLQQVELTLFSPDPTNRNAGSKVHRGQRLRMWIHRRRTAPDSSTGSLIACSVSPNFMRFPGTARPSSHRC